MCRRAQFNFAEESALSWKKLRTMTHSLGVSELGERKDRTCVRFSEKWGTSLRRQWIQNYQLPDIQIGTPALELRVLLNFMEGD